MPTSSIELSLNALRAVAFIDENLECLRPISPAPGDIAHVKILPLAIAKVIKDCDPEDEVFHVVLFPSHGELWLSFDWKESNARLYEIRQGSKEDRAIRLKTDTRLHEIACKLVKFGVPAGDTDYLKTLSSRILENYKQGKANEILRILNIVELLNSYEKEDSSTDKT